MVGQQVYFLTNSKGTRPQNRKKGTRLKSLESWPSLSWLLVRLVALSIVLAVLVYVFAFLAMVAV